MKNQWGFLEVTDKSARLDKTKLYDNLGDINLPWFGQPGTRSGYYLVEKDGKLGLVTASFEPVISPSWLEIHPVSDQYFLVADAAGYSIIDAGGKAVLKGEGYQAVKLAETGEPSFFLLKQNGKWGVKKKGRTDWSVKPEYLELEFLDVGTDGLFKVRKDKAAGSKWQVINWEAKDLPALTGAFERVEAAGRLHLATQETIRQTDWSIRDLTGKEVLILGPETEIKPLNDHLFGYRESGSNAYSVLVMREQISPLIEKFDHLQTINQELVFYTRGETAGFIHADGSLTEIEVGEAPEVVGIEGDLLTVNCRATDADIKKWGVYSLKENRFVQDLIYDYIGSFQGNFARVLQDGKTGLINNSGELIVPTRYENIPYLEPGIDSIYGYWSDSVRVYPVAQGGNTVGTPYAVKSTAVMGPERYYWMDYRENAEETKSPQPVTGPSPTSATNGIYWNELIPENPQDTFWIEEGVSYWQLMGDSYQLMRQEEVEVVVRDRSSSSKSKKKNSKKGKKTAAPTPRRTEMVMKWVKKGVPFKSLREVPAVNWTLAYHDDNDLVSNELTFQGRTRLSVRKISIFLNETNTLLPDLEITGIRLSDFQEGLPYAAFFDLDGKMGLIDQKGNQAVTADGTPLRFTYIGKMSEGKIRVCDPSSAFDGLGLNKAQVFQEFNVEVLSNAGGYIRELQSTGPPRWGYINPDGQLLIPLEYESATSFQENFAVNQKNGKWGAINGENEVVIPFEYDEIALENGAWKVVKGGDGAREIFYDDRGRRFFQEEFARLSMQGNRLFPVQSRDSLAKYGYADADGVVMIPFQFDEASGFMDGLATVRVGRDWFFIDEKGKQVISIDPDIIGIIEVGNFNEGLCPIRKTTILNKKSTRKYGYLNTEGKLAIEPRFDGASVFNDGLAIVDSLNLSEYKPGQSESIPVDRALIDKKGNLITDFDFRHIYPFNEAGFAEVIHATTGRRSVIGKDGKLLTGDYYKEVKTFEDGMAVSDGNSWKVFDYSGKPVSLPESGISDLNYFAGNDLFVKDRSDSWNHLTVSGNKTEKKRGDFKFLQPFENGYAYARTGDQNMLYGRDQSPVYPEAGQLFKFWSAGLIGIKDRTAEYYANPGLQNVFSREFDTVNKFNGNCAVVGYLGKFGIINRNGLFIVPPKFDEISEGKEGHFKAQLSGRRFGLRSKDGKEIIPAKYDAIRSLPNGIFRVEYADFVGYYRADGEPLWELEE